MRVVVQRVSSASVLINDSITRNIEQGFLILVGITHQDTRDDIMWMIKKICGLRVFGDDQGKMNLNIDQVFGSFLVVSQFTLHASTKKGNRPSFIKAAPPKIAIPLYEEFLSELSNSGREVKTGEFGADMKITLVNDGPVTIFMDSKNRE